MKRTASASWRGGFKKGEGVSSSRSGVFADTPYRLPSCGEPRIPAFSGDGSIMTARSMLGALIVSVIVFLLAGATGCTHTRPFTDAAGRPVPDSIAAMETWMVGNSPQSLWIRGLDVRQPAVILLHGGPGTSESGLFRHYDADLERHFLMVYWEQRGAGRSYHSALPRDSMTIEQFERDLDEVVDRVRQRFGKDRVILLAHSWGTVLGTIYAYRHPEKVAAYIGIGQIADFAEGERLSYDWALSEAVRRRHSRASADLDAMRPGPRSVDEELRKGRWVEAFGGVFHRNLSTGTLIRAALSTDEVNLVDLWKFGRGNRFSLENLRPQYSKVDLTRYRSFAVPVLFFLGRYDWQTPAVLAERYFETLTAPCKRLVWFERSAHNPPFEEPEAFVHAMATEVLPLADGSKTCPRSS
ncbi:MAG TPA: alpha/beta fold hydrolase [Candidatus Competibacter sp.]|nr:alpha/beta fold hydrolase [Candidatus Competibacter sp.]